MSFIKRIIIQGIKVNELKPLRLFQTCSASQYRNIFSRRKLSSKELCQTTTTISVLHHKKFITVLEHQNIDGTPDEIYSENEFAQTLFYNSHYYSKTVVSPRKVEVYINDAEVQGIYDKNWLTTNSNELLSGLKTLSYYSSNKNNTLDAEKCQNILQALHDKCETFNNNEIKEVLLYLIPMYQSLKNVQEYKASTAKLDTICYRRAKEFSLEDKLLLCDMFYKCASGKGRGSSFVWHTVRKLGWKPHKLTPKNLVQLLFILNVCRNTAPNMFEIECCVHECIDQFSVNELGIIAMGFFKTSTPLRNTGLQSEIIQKVMNNLDQIHSVSLGAIMKLLRISMKPSEISLFRILLKSIEPHIPRLTLMSLIHIAHASARILVYETKIIYLILDRLNEELMDARLKDIERILYAMMTFNIETNHPLYEKLISELPNREEEIMAFRRVLPIILHYLSFMNIYPKDLIARVMDAQYIKKVQQGNISNVTREYLVLDQSLKIEVPDYDGPFLEKYLRNYLTRKFSTNNLEEKTASNANLFSMDFLHAARTIFKCDLSVHQVLPHFNIKTVPFGIDKDNNIVPYESISSIIPNTNIKNTSEEPMKDVRWFIFVLHNIACCLKGVDKSTGMQEAFLRQLKLLKYTPIVIKQTSWPNESTEFKVVWLKSVLSEHTELSEFLSQNV